MKRKQLMTKNFKGIIENDNQLVDIFGKQNNDKNIKDNQINNNQNQEENSQQQQQNNQIQSVGGVLMSQGNVVYEYEQEMIQLYGEIFSNYHDKNYIQLEEQLGVLGRFLTPEESDTNLQVLKNERVPLFMKCQYLGIIHTLIKDKVLLQNNSVIVYDAIRCLSNVCSSDDLFVKEVLNYTPDFIPILIKVFERVTSVDQLLNIYQQLNLNNVDCLIPIQNQLSITIGHYKIAENIIFCFTNMIGNVDTAINTQVKAFLVNYNIMSSVIQAKQNYTFVLEKITQFQQLLQQFGNVQQINFEINEMIFNFNPITSQQVLDFYQAYTWFLSSFQKKPLTRSHVALLDSVSPVLLDIFDQYKKVQNEDAYQILINILWYFQHQTQDNDFYSRRFVDVIQKKRLQFIIASINSLNGEFGYLCLRIVTNLLSGLDQIIQVLIDLGVLDQLQQTLSSWSSKVRIETSWALSNICASSPIIIQQLLDNNALYSKMLYLVQYDKSAKVRKELLKSIANLISCVNHDQIKNYLFTTTEDNTSVQQILVTSLTNNDFDIVLELLDGIEYLLEKYKDIYTSSGKNYMIVEFERFGLTDKLEILQKHKCDKIYYKVDHIIEKYFCYADDQPNYCDDNEYGDEDNYY